MSRDFLIMVIIAVAMIITSGIIGYRYGTSKLQREQIVQTDTIKIYGKTDTIYKKINFIKTIEKVVEVKDSIADYDTIVTDENELYTLQIFNRFNIQNKKFETAFSLNYTENIINRTDTLRLTNSFPFEIEKQETFFDKFHLGIGAGIGINYSGYVSPNISLGIFYKLK